MEKKKKSKTQNVVAIPKPVKARVAKPVRKVRAVPPSPPRPVISPQERHRRIAEAAYFLALRRGISHSDPQKNWIDAERQIDADLALHGIRVG